MRQVEERQVYREGKVVAGMACLHNNERQVMAEQRIRTLDVTGRMWVQVSMKLYKANLSPCYRAGHRLPTPHLISMTVTKNPLKCHLW